MAEADLQKPLNSTGNRFVTFFLGIPILNSTEGEKKIQDFILNWHLLATYFWVRTTKPSPPWQVISIQGKKSSEGLSHCPQNTIVNIKIGILRFQIPVLVSFLL